MTLVESPPWESPQWQEAVSQNPGLAPFFDNLESFVELPGGIKKLRQLIMELGVAGKLLGQNADDEPVSILLERISTRRAELVESKVIRGKTTIRDKKLPETELPPGWTWANFGEITFNRDGDRIPVRKSDRENQEKTYDYYGASGVIDKVAGFIFDQPLLLIGEDGANLINRSTPIAFIAEGKYWVNNHAHAVDLISRDMMDYVALFINSISLEPYITGMAQPKMNQAKMNSIPVALPPLAEQRRIVSKVEGLMMLCDTLESQRQARMSVRERASRSVLVRLTSAPAHPPALADQALESERQGASRRYSTGDVNSQEPTASALSLTKEAASAYATSGKLGRAKAAKVAKGETLQSSWQRLSDHFEVLLDQPETLAHLRQSILQLAVQGKLVPQDPRDEPAGELARKIIQEKADLIAAKKLKKSSSHTKRDRGTQDWELPVGWVWTIVDDLTSVGTGTTPTKGNQEYYQGGTVPWITSASTNSEFIEQPTKHVTELAVKERNMRLYPKGSLVVALYGQGKTRGQVGQLMFDSTSNEANAVLEFFGTGWECRDYFRLVFQKKYHELRELAAGGAQPNLSGGLIRLTKIPLPPLAEQKRIVSKVSALLSQLDELSARVRSRQSTTDALLTALIHQILERNSGEKRT